MTLSPTTPGNGHPGAGANGKAFAPGGALGGALGPAGRSGGGFDGDELDLAGVLQALRRRRRLALAMFATTLLAGALITAWQRTYRPVFQGSFKLLVTDPINNAENTIDQGDGSGSLQNLALRGAGTTNTSTLIEVLASPLLLAPIERKLGLGEGSLAPSITVPKATATGTPGLLVVTMQWPDPVEGREILEQLTRSYLAYSLRQRQEKLTQGLAFLDQQAPALQSRVKDLQNEVAAFRRRTGFVEPVEQATAIKNQQLALGDTRKTLEQQQARLEGMAAAVQRGQLNNSSFLPGDATLQPGGRSGSGSGLEAGGVTNLVGDLLQVEKQLAEAEATYTETAPQVQELRAKRNKLRPLLQRRQMEAIRSSLSENQAQLAAIQRQQEQLAGRFLGNPAQMKQYDSLQQELAVARDNLTSYIKARENFRLQVAQRTVPWSVLAPPQFGQQPVKPSVSRNLMLSALLGGLAGVGLALLRDWLDHVYHSPKELQEGLAAPLLGVVPYLSGRAGSTISQSLAALEGSERFAIKEALRNLFANFRLLRADKPVRLVAITSSAQGEGKTTTTALFAQTLAQLGQRVLLVDADMRRPMLHRYVGVDNLEGFSSVLTDPEIALEGVVRTVQPGLDLLTAGPVPPDPTQLLSSERCGAVAQMIRSLPGYDLVLFDTPPALLLSDPVLLAEHLDGLIFLVGLSRVNRDLPAQALQRVRDTGVDVLGVLANQPVRRSSGSMRYGYGYGYGYGPKSGYGDYASAAEQQEGSANGEAVAVSRPSRSVPPPKKRLSSLRAGSRRLMHWLDERE